MQKTTKYSKYNLHYDILQKNIKQIFKLYFYSIVIQCMIHPQSNYHFSFSFSAHFLSLSSGKYRKINLKRIA